MSNGSFKKEILERYYLLQQELSPQKIVSALGKYIVGQEDAKRAVAIAIRNRIRRKILPTELREEIRPSNILMIGPTGCGKTEIARRMARLIYAPFAKVEATKYTEVGYVGRDVESMVRDLLSSAVNIVKKEHRKNLIKKAEKNTKDRILNLLLPRNEDEVNFNSSQKSDMSSAANPVGLPEIMGKMKENLKNESTTPMQEREKNKEERKRVERVRERFSKMLEEKKLEDKEIELETQSSPSPMLQIMGGPGNLEDMDMYFQNMLGSIMPKKQTRRKLPIKEARKIILEEEIESLLDHEAIRIEAVDRAENLGIIFIDEVDKICGNRHSTSADVSREGVQRDLLPLVEGAIVNTKYGIVKTDHILFISAGAFHMAEPSDLIPELQGRFPIQVELDELTKEDFRRILTNPKNSLISETKALLETENLSLEFTAKALDKIAEIAYDINIKTENIGARRLRTVLAKVLERISFDAPDLTKNGKKEIKMTVDEKDVIKELEGMQKDPELDRYIL